MFAFNKIQSICLQYWEYRAFACRLRAIEYKVFTCNENIEFVYNKIHLALTKYRAFACNQMRLRAIRYRAFACNRTNLTNLRFMACFYFQIPKQNEMCLLSESTQNCGSIVERNMASNFR